jgi:O-antigen ligase
MLAKAQWKSILSKIYLPMVIVGFAALWFSPAIVSIVTAICGTLFLAQAKTLLSESYKTLLYPVLVLLLLVGIDLVFHSSASIVVDKCLLILGFAFLFLSGSYFQLVATKNLVFVFLILSSIVLLINVLSVSNYFMQKEYYDQLLLQSKSIPIAAEMHHIHFGIINAIALLGLGGLLVLGKVKNGLQVFTVLAFIVIFFCFHILSSRTGLVAFYASVFVSIITYAIQSGKRKVIYIGVVAIPLMLVSSYFFSSSFQNKVLNSIEDVQSWGNPEEINYKSMAMRIEAYKVSLQVILQNPIGVGAGAMDQGIQETYERNESVLYKENRKDPHNQFLEFGVKYGWIGILALLFFFYQLVRLTEQSWFPVLGLVTLLFVAMQFESLLERQASIYTIGLFLPLFIVLFSKNETNGTTLT